MAKNSFSSIITAVLGWVSIASAGSAAPPPDARLSLWYRQAAGSWEWESRALPIGNGRLGGMVFGGVAQEQIQFNEISVWTGNKTTRGSYQNFGDLVFDFTGLTGETAYRRELSIEEAVARVRFTAGSVDHNREYFVSYPDNVMIMRFTASAANSISGTVRVVDAHTGTLTVSGNRLTMAGSLTLLSYEAQVVVVAEGGAITSGTDRILVAGANAVTVLMAGGTNFDPLSPAYTRNGLHDTITQTVNAAAARTYAQLKTRHLDDFQPLFNRVALRLNDTRPTMPTDSLLARYRSGSYDPALEVLYFQYGRYLMLACSRGGLALPSNLQGIWCNSNTPMWQCDIHSNINVQMNYWPA
ncbi:MAG: glycoside hydrolase family 95 protein, partial [Chitinispirillaceae bacterium]|nr:glycoside hydrolase family 95 protein [Chitinispirillaceae bacterium]